MQKQISRRRQNRDLRVLLPQQQEQKGQNQQIVRFQPQRRQSDRLGWGQARTGLSGVVGPTVCRIYPPSADGM